MQRVLVTAGASGIGRAIAEGFLERGDKVAVCDVDSAALEAFAAANPQALCRQVSVTDEAAMDALFQELENSFGGLDVVCANAGTAGPAGPVESLQLDDWRACVAVNLDGAFLTARGAARLFKAQRSGLLLLTSSTAGFLGYPNRSPYAAAKWAVTGLMKTLAMELGEYGIRVNTLCPGAVEGERMERVIANEARARGVDEAQVRQDYVRGVSLRSWVKAEDIAAMALFLASPAGAKISGQSLAIDGHTETLAP